MSRGLIIDGNKMVELFGKQYIPFSEWNPTIPDRKVTGNEQLELIDDLGDIFQAEIFKNPQTYKVYDQSLTIKNHEGSINIKHLGVDELLIFDTVNMMITNNLKCKVFKNFKMVEDQYFDYTSGDIIHISTYLSIYIKGQAEFELTCYEPQNIRINTAQLDGLKAEYKDFPLYTNSPKLKYSISETKVDLRAPKEAERKNSLKEIVKKIIPTLVTFTLTIVLMYFKPRGPYVIISLTSTIISVIIMIISFIDDKRENKKFNQERERIYEENLHNVTKELTALKTEEEYILRYLYPRAKEVINEIKNNSSRLYERDSSDDDFLKLNIGITDGKPTYTLSNPVDDLKINKEKLELRVDAIYEQFKQLNRVPKVVDLYRDNIGLIGSQSVLNSQVSDLLLQVLFFHSYHDLKIIPIITPNERHSFDHFKFTKHFQFEDGLYTIIDDELTRDAILSGVVQVLRARSNSEGDKMALPIFIFVISNFDLIANHPIMEFLNESNPKLGFRILFLSERQENLINNLQTIIEFKNSNQAEMIIENKIIDNSKFMLNPPTNRNEAIPTIKKVGQLEHIKGVKSSLPDSISFLEMYNVERVEDLQISSRWQQNRTDKSIKALVGKKSQVDEVYLDLHEKVHGPHGLVAGTTGSGKSEVIQTYILSLAINYSPEYVGFLLIDYKGGGMANLFKDMPHLLGSITNLDGYLAMRAMESIKGELKRRQSIFAKYEVNHINGYHKLYEQGKVSEPLPHLFLISDEFAELKSNEPEFMKELVSAARIGRSLGIHLILATQKPSGVVDDQIWSNSKFKLCLKVAEPADSRELLKTTDAAYIVEPGRGYLKVGTNELYELFQSGYSGAPYNKGDSSSKDERVYAIDKYGREKLLNPKENTKELESEDELTVVLKQVNSSYELANYTPVIKPWLPPLEDNVALELEYKQLDETPLDLQTNIGMIDIPSKQSQVPLTINLLEEGNVGIFGTVQTGKTTTAQSILISLASKNSPENLSYYILDFGNGKLVSLKGLKHTADYLTIEDSDKLQKFFKYLKQEIKMRKEKLSAAMASNFGGYNQVADKPLQAIVVVLDNYDVLRDMGELGTEFNFLYREGASLGIYMITTANKMSSLRLPHQAAISTAIQHFTTDRTDVSNSLGSRTNYELKEIQGRVQVKVETPEVAQVYLPVPAETEKEYINNLKQAVETINSNTTYSNNPLPMMPEVVEYKPEYKQQDKIFLGLDYEDIAPQYITIRDVAITGGNGLIRSNLIKNMLKQIKQSIELVIDDNGMHLYELFNDCPEVYYTKNDIEQINEKLETLIETRQNAYDQYVAENGFIVPKFYFDTQSDAVIVLRGLRNLNEVDITNKNKLLVNLKKLRDLGVDMIIDTDDSKGIDEITKLAKTFSDFILLCATNEQQLKPMPKAVQCGKENVIYVDSGEIKKIKKEGI